MNAKSASFFSTTLVPPAPTRLVSVLHLINGEHFSGAERVQDLLAMSMPKFGYKADFACLKADKFPLVRQSRTLLHELEMNSKFSLNCFRDVVDLARKHQYKVLHAHTPRTLMIGAMAARKLGCPFVYHVHSPVSRDSGKLTRNCINAVIEKMSLTEVNRMICVSESLRNYMYTQGHSDEKLRVVANGVEPVPSAEPRTVAPKVWTIGTVALFRPRKGTEVLIRALRQLKDQGLSVKLLAVGPFETQKYHNEIMDLAEDLGVSEMIEWTGFEQDTNAQLKRMDMLVLPSLYGEGLPMVVLEAMAMGVPVIASNVEGIPEAIRHGVDGVIFKAGDSEALAGCVSKMVSSPIQWRAMSEASLKRQRNKLSSDSMARGVAEIYDELLAK